MIYIGLDLSLTASGMVSMTADGEVMDSKTFGYGLTRDFKECGEKAKAALAAGDKEKHDFWREEAAMVRDSIKSFRWRLNNN